MASPTDNTNEMPAAAQESARLQPKLQIDLLYEAGRVACDTQPHLARKGRITGRIKIVAQAKQFFFCWEPYPEAGKEHVVAQYALNHPLQELHSLQRRNSHLIVILNQGMTLPPFYFEDGTSGVKNFIAFCRANLDFEPSPQDANVYLRKPSPTLIRSLEGLGMSVQETVREAKWTFFEKLSLVTKFTREQLFEGQQKRYPGKNQPEPLASTPSFDAAVHEAANGSAVASIVQDVQCQQRAELGDLGEFDVLNVKVTQVAKECHRRGPMTMSDWEQFVDADGQIIDEANVREAIFYGGCDPDCRKEVWKFLLNHRPSCKAEAGKFRKLKEEEYFVMKNQWITMTSTQLERNQPWSDTLHRIQKDVFRTDREQEFFAGDNNANLDKLHDILATYCTYNYDLGYVQGMNDLLAVILMVVDDEVDGFWCFANIMETMGSNFSMDQMGMTGHLSDLRCLLRFMDPELMDYLEKHDSGNLFFCFRWMLINFKREFVLDDIMILWEAIWSQWLSPQYHLFIALAILHMHRLNLMRPGQEFDDILQYINNLALNMDVEAVLNVAEQLHHRLAQYKPSTVPDELRRIVKPWKLLHANYRRAPRSTDGLLTSSSPAHSWLDVGDGSEAESEPLSEPVMVSTEGLAR